MTKREEILEKLGSLMKEDERIRELTEILVENLEEVRDTHEDDRVLDVTVLYKDYKKGSQKEERRRIKKFYT